jgi:hypothetical protein
MAVPAPTAGDRRYLALIGELLKRIPAYTPEWTEVHESDPGVTSVVLLAFLAEDDLFGRRSDCKSSAGVLRGRLIPGIDLSVIQRSSQRWVGEYLAPGIYSEEVRFRPRPIGGVSTSTARVVGPASRCAANLAEDLRARVRCRPISVPDESHQDVEDLLRSLRIASVPSPRNRRRQVAIAIGAVALGAIVGIMFWRPRGGGPVNKGAEDVTSDSVPDEEVRGFSG